MFNARDKRFECEPVERIDPGQLEVFDYQFPGKAIRVVTTTEEFTSVCPYSGLPDYGTVTIEYVPKAKVIELRSLKYYLMTYRNVGIFYEHLINKMLEDLVAACQPECMTISIDFTPRGGLRTSVRAEYPR
jgi:7-cyano-7-deazaguanine reductase